ncbi:uncharacterized protein CXorf49 homolog isoform X4 [Cervus canadensis]|uniref:uncharacterized protein CXorf49 homolog isoform X4 n=1 Tax=Cervus canadensis TaxID=1574408 RepID=UPI001CA34C45|nr:uncharacterized protein CXorf49 homolog isoform X4 [Cervus canadensis]
MSSTDDEVSVSGAGFGSECREHIRGLEAGSTAPRGPGPSPEPGTLGSGEGEGGNGFPDPEGFESERELLEARGLVLWGREGWPGSPADDQGDALQLADESVAAILQQLADLSMLGTRRCLFQESYPVSEVSGLWDLEANPTSQDGATQRCGETAQAEAVPLGVGRLKAGRAWGNPMRDTKSRLNVAVDHQWPPLESTAGLLSDPESSDEFNEIELRRVSIYPKDGGQAKLNSPEDPGNTPRRSNVQGRENLLNVPGTCLSLAPWGLISVVEREGRQGDAEQEDISPPKKMQSSVLWGKGGSLPSYPGVAVASATAAAATGSRPRPTPRRKGVQEKKSLGGDSKPAAGRTFPSWGQGISATPLEPATFPPISGIPLLGRSKKYALVPWGAEESKHTGAGKKPVARQARELVAVMVVSGEDNDPNRDPFPKGQLTTDRPGPSCPWVHHGEPSGANLNIRGAQDSGNSEPVAMNKGEVRPRGPGPSGDQEPTDHPPRPRRQEQLRGRQGCPRCLVLQREIDDLKEQLASMRYLADKFQIV